MRGRLDKRRRPDRREPLLIQVFFGGQLSDAELVNVLQNELQTVTDNLAIFTSIYNTIGERPNAEIDRRSVFLTTLTLEYGLAAQVALRKWLQAAIQRLQAQTYTPAHLSDLTGDVE